MSRLEAASAEEAVRAWTLNQALMRAQRSMSAAQNMQRDRRRLPTHRLRQTLEAALEQVALYEAATIAVDRLRILKAVDDRLAELDENHPAGA